MSLGVGVAAVKLLLPALSFEKLMIRSSGQLVSSDRDSFNTFHVMRRTHPVAFIENLFVKTWVSNRGAMSNKRLVTWTCVDGSKILQIVIE